MRERPAKLLLSLREAAALLGIGRCNTLPRLIAEGRIRTVSIAGRVRVPLDEVQRIAREGTDPHPVKRQRVTRRTGDREADQLAALKIT